MVRLGKKDELKASVIQERLTEEYLPFFEHLASFYKSISLAPEAAVIHQTLIKIKRATQLVSRLFFGRGLTVPTKEEFERLNVLLEDIETARLSLVEKAAQNLLVKTAIDEAVELTGISPQELNLSENLSKRAKGKGGELPGTIGKLLSSMGVSPGRATAGAIASQILAPILGPLFGTAVLAGGAGMLAYKGAHKLFGGISGLMGQFRGRGGGMGVRARGGGSTPVSTPSMSPTAGFMGSPSMSTQAGTATMPTGGGMVRDFLGRFFGRGDEKSLKLGAMPIWYFFDKLAYRARWTKDIAAALKTKGSGERGGGLMEKAMDVLGLSALGRLIGLKGALLGLKLGGLVGAIAFATYEITKLVKTVFEYFNVKKEAGAQVEKQVGVKQKFWDKETTITLSKIKGMNVSDERKRALRVQHFKRMGNEFAIEKANAADAKTSWLGQRWGEFKSGMAGFGRDIEGVQPLSTTASVPMPAAYQRPEIVVPPAGRLSDNLEQNQKIVEGLAAIKDEVKAGNKTGSIGHSVGGPYDSLSDPLLKGLNSSGADNLSSFLGK